MYLSKVKMKNNKREKNKLKKINFYKSYVQNVKNQNAHFFVKVIAKDLSINYAKPNIFKIKLNKNKYLNYLKINNT